MTYNYCELIDIISGNLDGSKINPALIDQKNKFGETPLIRAVTLGNSEVAELLIGIEGINVANKGSYDWTPLSVAIMLNNDKIAKILIEKGLYHSTGTDSRSSNFHIAIVCNNFDLLKLLLEKNPDLIKNQNKDGFTLLDYASEFGNDNIIAYLKEKNAPRNKTSEVALACESNTKEKQNFYNYAEMIDIISSNFDKKLVNLTMINQINAMGYSLLMQAIILNNSEMALALIEMGADVNLKTDYERTALHWAIRRNMTDVAKLIINKQEALKDDGTFRIENNLIMAIIYDNSGIVQALLEKGFDVNLANKNGFTPLDYAVEYGNETIQEILIKSGAKNSEGFESTADELKRMKKGA